MFDLDEKLNTINNVNEEISTIQDKINKENEKINNLYSKKNSIYNEITNFIRENCKEEIKFSRMIYTINQDEDNGACLSEDHDFDLSLIVNSNKIIDIEITNKPYGKYLSLIYNDDQPSYFDMEYNIFYFYNNSLFIIGPAQYDYDEDDEYIIITLCTNISENILNKLKLELSL